MRFFLDVQVLLVLARLFLEDLNALLKLSVELLDLFLLLNGLLELGLHLVQLRLVIFHANYVLELLKQLFWRHFRVLARLRLTYVENGDVKLVSLGAFPVNLVLRRLVHVQLDGVFVVGYDRAYRSGCHVLLCLDNVSKVAVIPRDLHDGLEKVRLALAVLAYNHRDALLELYLCVAELLVVRQLQRLQPQTHEVYGAGII